MNTEHLTDWIHTGRAVVIDKNVSRTFGAYIDTLPWSPSGMRLDWSKVPHQSLRLSKESEADIVRWAAGTGIGSHTHLVVWYGPEREALLGRFEDVIRNLDLLFWKAPGTRYVFGADRTPDGHIEYSFADLIEFDGGEELRATN